jgi:hypothetical protein
MISENTLTNYAEIKTFPHRHQLCPDEIHVTNIDEFKNELKEKLNLSININREKYRKLSLEDRQKQDVLRHLIAYNKVSRKFIIDTILKKLDERFIIPITQWINELKFKKEFQECATEKKNIIKSRIEYKENITKYKKCLEEIYEL